MSESEPLLTMDRRARRLADVCELVVRVMELRPPQAHALRRLCLLLQALPKPLCECSPQERRAYMTEGDQWLHVGHPSFTFALATGIGKTRLAGAVMALLFLSKEARTFLILAPRRAVLRRFSDALDPSFREYIFVEPGLVPEPLVVSSDQIDSPTGVEAVLDIFRLGPTVYLLSPQLITTSDRFKGSQVFTGVSPREHLQGKQDLVVLFDEAHHVGGLGKAEAAQWTEAIRDLSPTLQIGLTATPRGDAGENVLYEYPLSKALLEQLYTKDVHLLVRNFEGSLLSEEEIDRATIQYALERLAIKEREVAGAFVEPLPAVKPVCLFFAKDISHAEWVARVLTMEHGLDSQKVLLTHSRARKSEEELNRLLSIESLDNPVRVVVNVQELTEGWDVRNVYVVAPLRAMATFQGAVQAMGRGLRLPAGMRVGVPEADTLDVVCFGRESLRAIIEQATQWLGKNTIGCSGGVLIDEHDTKPRHVRRLLVRPQRPAPQVNLHALEPVQVEVSIRVEPQALSDSARMSVEDLDLARLSAQFAKQRLVRVPRSAFVQAATMRALRTASQYLADDVHYGPLSEVVAAWLVAADCTSEYVEFDPAQVGEQIGRLIVDGARRRPLEYQSTGRRSLLEVGEFVVELDAVEEGTGEATLNDVAVLTEATFSAGALARGFNGHEWRSSIHPAYSFDSVPELRLAWLLDHDSLVEWWIRNEPRRLRIPTAAGWYSPDFVVWREGKLLLVEAKGAVYWESPDSEARVKARSAEHWAAKQSAQSGFAVDYSVILASDINAASSFGDALTRRVQPWEPVVKVSPEPR